MTATPLPLAARPRRSVVRRPPTLTQAERALRRSAAPTTTRVWSIHQLDGVVARAGVPAGEAAASLFLVAVGFVPALVWSHAAPGALLTLAVSLVVTSLALWARRVVVGQDVVAVRSLLRYRVAHVDHLRHLRLRPTQRGGQLCLHTDDGHSLHLRRVEVERPAVRDALRALAGCGRSTRDPLTCALLSLDADPERTLHVYQPAA